jgi:hypothetical protein
MVSSSVYIRTLNRLRIPHSSTCRAQVGTLRRSGPLGLDELCDQPDFVDWPARRVEQAVITAWSDNLIFVDPRDLLVAL